MWMERHILRGEKVTGNQHKGELVPKALSSFTCESWAALSIVVRRDGRHPCIYLGQHFLFSKLYEVLFSHCLPQNLPKLQICLSLSQEIPLKVELISRCLEPPFSPQLKNAPQVDSGCCEEKATCIPAQATPKTCYTGNLLQTSLHCNFPTRPCGLNDSSLLSQGSECGPIFPGSS